MQLQERAQIKIKILNVVLNYIQVHNWTNYDDFADDFTNDVLEQFEKNNFDLDNILDHTKGSFLQLNGIKKEQFLDETFRNSLLKSWNKITKYAVPVLHLTDIFPEISEIHDSQVSNLLDELNMDEKIVQTSVRNALREKGATPIARRTGDSALEVAEPEHFDLKINGKDFGFTVVVKGYNSIKAKKISWKEVAHQITRAYRTHPDYILVISAKEPVDGFVTEIRTYGSDVGNSHLVIFVPPMDLAKFLRWRKTI